jgi:hypothetical protein
MSTLAKKLLSANLQNMLVIALAFGLYVLAAKAGFPILLQLACIGGLLLAFLEVNEEVPS